MPFICIVCREKLTIQGQDGQIQIITSTECGHLFHQNCLKENFEKRVAFKALLSGKIDLSKPCPQCQRVIDLCNNRQIFPSEIEDIDIEDQNLREENENLQGENFMLKGRLRNLEMRLNAPTSSQNLQPSGLMDDFNSSVRYYSNPTIIPMTTTDSGLLRIGDFVVWFGADGESHDGAVKWIGSINDEIYSGIEFDENIGNDYPEVEGRRLFTAAPFRGRLVRTRELLLQKDFYGE